MQLGLPHPDYLLKLLTPQQWLDWQAYYRVDPWGGFRGDVQAAIVASAAVSPHVKKPMPPSKFLPSWSRPKNKRMSQKQLFTEMQTVAAIFAGSTEPVQPCPEGKP